MGVNNYISGDFTKASGIQATEVASVSAVEAQQVNTKTFGQEFAEIFEMAQLEQERQPITHPTTSQHINIRV